MREYKVRILINESRAAFELNKKSSIQIRISRFCDRFRVQFMTLSLKKDSPQTTCAISTVEYRVVLNYSRSTFERTGSWPKSRKSVVTDLMHFYRGRNISKLLHPNLMMKWARISGGGEKWRRKMNRFTIKYARIFFSISNLPINSIHRATDS